MKKILYLSLFIVLLPVLSFAATFYNVGEGETLEVEEWGACSKIINNCASGIFIPTNSSSEWSAFRNKKPDCVDLSSCAVAPTVSLSADSTSLAYGGSTTLRWTVNDATSCTASGSWSGPKNTSSGSESTGSLYSNKTYTLSCTGPGGTTNKSVTITVASPPPPPSPAVSLSANTYKVAYGGSTTLNWSVNNATSCTATGGWSGSKSASGGSESTGSLYSATDFYIDCYGSGGSHSDYVRILVDDPIPSPSVSVWADEDVVGYNKYAYVNWSVSNATSCTASGGWSGSKSTSSGRESVGKLTSNSTYTLSCTGSGGSDSDSVTITIAPPSVSLTADSYSLSYGGSTMLRWSVSNATSCTASGGWSGSKGSGGGNASTGNLYSSTSFYITCTGPGGSDSSSVTIAVAAQQPTCVVRCLELQPSSCNDVCSSYGQTCSSIGTNAGATDGYFRRETFSSTRGCYLDDHTSSWDIKGTCSSVLDGCSLAGGTTYYSWWTYCLCCP